MSRRRLSPRARAWLALAVRLDALRLDALRANERRLVRQLDQGHAVASATSELERLRRRGRRRALVAVALGAGLALCALGLVEALGLLVRACG